MEQLGKVLKLNLPKPNSTPQLSQALSAVGPELSREEMLDAVKSLTICFPNVGLTEEKVKAWHILLKDMSLEQLRKGTMVFLRNHLEIFPNTNIPAYIRKYGLSVELNYPTAAEAWGLVLKEVSRVGSYSAPQIQNPMVQKATTMLGWRDICLSDNVEAVRAHFMKMYESLIKREQDVAIMGPTLGSA